MDATQLPLKRHAIFVAFALLFAAASLPAQAQTFTVPSNITVAAFGFAQLTVGASTSGVNFTATINPPSAGSNSWLSLTPGGCSTTGNGTTGSAINVYYGCQAGGALSNLPMTITISAPGYTSATVTVTLGASTGTINYTVSPGSGNSMTLAAAVGAPATGSITLTTSSAAPISFTIANSNPASWLTVLQTSGSGGSVSSGQAAVLTVSASAQATSPAPATIQIGYLSQTISITVTFNVGGTGSGGLTLSQTTVNWNYNSGGSSITTPIGVTTGAATYTATVLNTISPANTYWIQLLSNTNATGTSVQGNGNTTLYLNSNSVLLTLPTGSYQATVQVTDSNNNNSFINVYLSVNGGTSTLTASPNPINISAPYGSSSFVSQQVTISSSVSGSVTAYVTGTGLTLSGLSTATAIAPGAPVSATVYANPGGLAQNTFAGQLVVTLAGAAPQTFPVNFTVGNGSGGSIGSSVAPGTLQFNYQTDGTQSSLTQSIIAGGISTFTVGTISQSWISVSPRSGTAPQQLTVSVSPTSLATGSYSGTIPITFGDGTATSVTVNLAVATGTPMVYAQPGSVVFNQQTGSPQTTVYLLTTNGSPLSVNSVTPSVPWLSIISATPTSAPGAFTIQASLANLPNGMNQGNFTVSYGTTTVTIPVAAYVTSGTGGGGTGVLTYSPSSIVLTAPAGSTTVQTATVNVNTTSSSVISFTAASQETSCTQATWLSVSPTSGNAYTNYGTLLTVSVDPTALSAGTCSGSIQLTSNGTVQSIPVTFTVGGGITLSASALTFSYTSGGTTPAAQSVAVTNSGGASVGYTAAASTSTGSGWLSVSPTSGTTGVTAPLSISVSPSSLAAGTYTGTIAVTPSGGTASNISVTLTVTSPTLSASPTSLSFSYQAGGSVPAAQSVTVTGGGFTASASSTGNWLSVTPTTSSTATTLSVSVSPSNLSAGSYNGTITVAGANGASGSSTVNVTLTVTAPLPTITAAVNAASYATGSVSPGEIISIGGTAIGPASPAFLTLDSNGNVSTSIGGVTVTIGGYAAPLVYASSGQINAIVPYQVAGQIAPSVVVKFLGQTSNGFGLTTTVAAPGIFTQNSQGTGPGAILNQNYSVNGPNSPAAKGSVVQVFMTGEGVTTPTAVTGKVNNVTNPSQLPVPLLPVSAMVGGQPAQVVFAAEAPGTVSGVLQVNLVIPSNVPSGANSIVISIGTTPSQSGVTVTVQ